MLPALPDEAIETVDRDEESVESEDEHDGCLFKCGPGWPAPPACPVAHRGVLATGVTAATVDAGALSPWGDFLFLGALLRSCDGWQSFGNKIRSMSTVLQPNLFW